MLPIELKNLLGLGNPENDMGKHIYISTSSFGVESTLPIDKLKAEGFVISFNPFGRKLTPQETIQELSQSDGVVAGTEAYPSSVIEQLSRLKTISRCGAGSDGIDKAALQARGITLSVTPDVHVTAVAEIALAGLLSLTRKIALHYVSMRSGEWEKSMGTNLSGKTVGLLGFGRVGRAFAQLLSGLSCPIMAYDPLAKSVPEGVQLVTSPQAIYKQADVISLHMPSTPDTKNLIDEKVLAQCKDTVLLVNTSRGDLVHENALEVFLKAHPQAGAYLDVFQQEPYKGNLSQLPNCVTTPHIATFTRETRVNMELEAVNNLINYFKANG